MMIYRSSPKLTPISNNVQSHFDKKPIRHERNDTMMSEIPLVNVSWLLIIRISAHLIVRITIRSFNALCSLLELFEHY